MTSIDFWTWAGIGALLSVVWSSLFEWVLHRYVMHRKVPGLEYSFERHATVHHRVFKADNTYTLVREEDKRTVPMAWWNGPALIVVSQIPFVIGALVTGSFGLLCGSLLAACAYYGAYEYLHWCMHVPGKRPVERSWIFFRLNGHHLLHHRYMNRNFNVVLPLADFLLGTLLLRSKVRFGQAMGPSIPDVQPREERSQTKPGRGFRLRLPLANK
jgi:hypothetical protein